MDVSERNKISANIKYLTECMNIIYTKIRVIGSDFFKEDGTPSDQMIISVEDYRHGTVTIAYRQGAIKICLDGTNYEIIFRKYKNNGFVFYNKELSIKYVYVDKPLNDTVHLIEIVKTVGDCVDYFKYTCVNDFYCALKYASKDKDGWCNVEHCTVDDSDIQGLIAYTMQKMDKKDKADFDDIESDEYKNDPELEKKLKEKEKLEIKKQIENYSGRDYSVIDFPLPDSFMYKITNKPYECVLPDKVQHFDDGEYIRRILEEEKNIERELSKEIRSCEDSVDNNECHDEDCDDDINCNNNLEQNVYYDYEDASDYDDYDENFEDDDLDYDSDIDSEDYKIINNRESSEYITEEDIIYMVDSETMDVQIETEELMDYYNEIEDFVKKIKAIIYGRKKKYDSQGDSFGNKSEKIQDKKEKYDKDI